MNFRQLDKTWIIAEIGVNHEGDKAVAEDLIRKAAASGADAVKFQTFEAQWYVSTSQPERHERVKKWQLPISDFRDLAGLARQCGVTFFSTPLGYPDVDALADFVPLYKISSGDITYLQLIRHAASKGKPMIVSTGLASEAEIRDAVGAVLAEQPQAAENGNLMLMHCVSAYPTPPEEANLRSVAWIRDTFGLPTGYSDHTLGTKACELAVAAGAVSLEKHFTYRKEDQAFHDHAISADPKDMRELVDAVRAAEVLLGKPGLHRGPTEAKMVQHMRRSIAAKGAIPAGTVVTADMLTYLRPAWGLLPGQEALVVGHAVKRAIAAGEVIKAEDVE